MPFEINLVAIGLRIEKLRGRLSQADFSARLGVDRKTVGTWERGERLPDTKALLSLLAEFDADPTWVLTGKGFTPSGTDDERELLSLFRGASLQVKAAAIGALQGGATPAPKGPRYTVQQTIHGNIQQQSSGDIINKGKNKV